MELICLKIKIVIKNKKEYMKWNLKWKTVAIIATVAAVLSFAAITVSAKTYTWTHTVSVASIPGSTDSITASMGGKGRMSDTFSSYPTIFDGYKVSNNKARAVNDSTGVSYGWKSFTLNSNGGPVTVTYGSSLVKGSYYVQYQMWVKVALDLHLFFQKPIKELIKYAVVVLPQHTVIKALWWNRWNFLN